MLIITHAVEAVMPNSVRTSDAAAARESLRAKAPSALAALTRLRAMRSGAPPARRDPTSSNPPAPRLSGPPSAHPSGPPSGPPADPKQEDMRRIDALMGRGAWDEARALIEDLLAVDPEDADFHASLAWVLFNTNSDDDADVNEMLLEINEALRCDENHDRALYYKGMILKRKGLYRRALACFREAVDLNRGNIDAKRELHLARKAGIR
jgi:tetratricopeptide (TPR) repeat protein